MMIKQLLTPIHEVNWLLAGDTVGDAFDHMQAYDTTAIPVLDWERRFVGTVTEADLRRHVGRLGQSAMSSLLSEVERRSHSEPVTLDADVSAIADASTPFVAVIDDSGKFLGVVERDRLATSRAA